MLAEEREGVEADADVDAVLGRTTTGIRARMLEREDVSYERVSAGLLDASELVDRVAIALF